MKDQHLYTTNNHTPRVLPQKHILPLPRYYKQVCGAAIGPPLAP